MRMDNRAMFFKSAFIVLSLFVSFCAYSMTISDAKESVHMDADGNLGPALFDETSYIYGLYLRDEYSRVARVLTIKGSVAEGRIVEAKEEWTWALSESYAIRETRRLDYDGTCFRTKWNRQPWRNTGYCLQQLDPEKPNYNPEFELTVTYSVIGTCFESKPSYAMDFYSESFDIAREYGVRFKATAQIPGEVKINLSRSSITPSILQSKLYKNNSIADTCLGARCTEKLGDVAAGETKVTVRTYDGYGCGQKAGGGLVKIESIVDNSIPHLHFEPPNDEGTGSFSIDPNSTSTVPPPKLFMLRTGYDARKEADFGVAAAYYTAGEYGVKETIKASLLTNYVEVVSSINDSKLLTIKVPNLVKIDKSRTRDDVTGGTITIEGSGSDDCDDSHNTHRITNRHSDYINASSMDGLVAFDKMYWEETGEHLCLNDASLKYGGFYDKGFADRKVGCHQGHRRGLGIDINDYGTTCPTVLKVDTIDCSFDDKGLPAGVSIDDIDLVWEHLRSQAVINRVFGREQITKAECLKQVAIRLDIYKVREKRKHIHYRLWP